MFHKAEAPLSGAVDTEPYSRDASEALARLKDGNRRFMDDRPLFRKDNGYL
ncbi:hypothetical protein [Nitrosomonas ureae]|uniref:hypothetical protein n=1 Tax=Nitrosomonas ureae TaxID=44577 RepID=UPI0015544E9E|nr:hypothetical protein [Nitrosomonas ureae]